MVLLLSIVFAFRLIGFTKSPQFNFEKKKTPYTSGTYWHRAYIRLCDFLGGIIANHSTYVRNPKYHHKHINLSPNHATLPPSFNNRNSVFVYPTIGRDEFVCIFFCIKIAYYYNLIMSFEA